MKKFFTMLMAIVMVITMTGSAHAAASGPYKDVSKDHKACEAIEYLKARGAFDKDFVKSGKFAPSTKTKWKEFYAVVRNLYGKKAASSIVDVDDVINADKEVTAKKLVKKLVKLADEKNVNMTWSASGDKVSHALLAKYFYIFVTFAPELEVPKK